MKKITIPRQYLEEGLLLTLAEVKWTAAGNWHALN
jgi:hypothetical protein